MLTTRQIAVPVLAASLGLFAACAEMDSEPAGPALPSTGELALSMDSTVVEGSFDYDGALVEFWVEEVDELVFELNVYVNGMGFDGIVGQEDGVAGLDGFAEASGDDTQIQEDDRLALMALYRRLNDDPEFADRDAMSPSFIMLRRVVGNWAQQPSTVEMTRTIMGEDNRTIVYLCSYVNCGYGVTSGSCAYWNFYYNATHDGECYNCSWGFCDGDRGDARTSQRPQLGDHYGDAPCDDSTYTWTGSTWSCTERDHWSYPNQVGNCFGRSGGGCGGDTQYTLDPTDHDGCVRNGHALASMWCNDEFLSASDDELFGNNCY